MLLAKPTDRLEINRLAVEMHGDDRVRPRSFRRLQAPGIERQERTGGPQGTNLAVVPEPRRRVAGRREAQGPGRHVEHHGAQRDHLLGAARRRQHDVQLLDGLARVAVLAEEHPQEVLDLERGDRRLDAVPGDIADHCSKPLVTGGVEVVEVAGHGPRARLVHAPDLEPVDLWEVHGRQPLCPRQGRRVGLLQHLGGPPLGCGQRLGEGGLGEERAPVAQRDRHGDEQHQERGSPTDAP